MITVALVDDHISLRAGIKILIELKQDIKVVIEASNGKELLDKLANSIIPDIAIIDIFMPIMNGYETTKELFNKYPSIKVIVLAGMCEEDAVINVIGLGAKSYICKSVDPSTLVKAIVAVHEKGFYLGDLVKKDYFLTRSTTKKNGFVGKEYLSKKELNFIQLTATELSYKEIASQLKVSPKTVENYRDNIFFKLDIKTRSMLVLYAYKNGLLS
ncbi:MAG: response regulator transcription factor [Bacteroidota bacterium]